MSETEHTAIKVHGVFICAKCGMKYPCLDAHEAAIKRGQERKHADNRHI